MAYVVQPGDRKWFRRCRRSWDLSSRQRRNLVPDRPSFRVDLDRALRDALAVYYFPGMWEWERSIVCPLAVQALERSMTRQRAAVPDPTDEQLAHWEAELNRGHGLLDRYLEWAPTVDRFWPVRVETDFDVQVPDWRAPGQDLVSPDGEPVRYQGRIDMLVVDEHDAYWMVRHRLTPGGFAALDRLILDDELLAACWAWEIFYLGMRITGTIHNELHPGGSPPEPAPPARRPRPARAFAQARAEHRRMYAQTERTPSDVVVEEGAAMFRRTFIPRSERQLAGLGRNLADEALEMVDPSLALYPAPGPHCGACAFREPCLTLQDGGDAEEILSRRYRTRPAEQPEEGRLGAVTWSMNRGAAPPRWRDR